MSTESTLIGEDAESRRIVANWEALGLTIDKKTPPSLLASEPESSRSSSPQEENQCYWVFTTMNLYLTMDKFTQEYLKALSHGAVPKGLIKEKHPNDDNFFTTQEALEKGLEVLKEKHNPALLVVCKVELTGTQFKSIFSQTSAKMTVPIAIQYVYESRKNDSGELVLKEQTFVTDTTFGKSLER